MDWVALAKLVLSIFKWLPGVPGIIETLTVKQELKSIADDLGALAFWEDGMLRPLRRIARGRGKSTDLLELSSQLDRTEDRVRTILDSLESSGERMKLINREVDLDVALDIQKVAFKKGTGPDQDSIRNDIRGLCYDGQPKGDWEIRSANEIVEQIGSFNQELITVQKRIVRARRRRPSA
jgi:hypothetical protein